MGWSVSRRRKCRTQEPEQASQNVSCGLLQSKDIHQCNGWTSKNVRDLLGEVRARAYCFVSAYVGGKSRESRESRGVGKSRGVGRVLESERVGGSVLGIVPVDVRQLVGGDRNRRDESWTRRIGEAAVVLLSCPLVGHSTCHPNARRRATLRLLDSFDSSTLSRLPDSSDSPTPRLPDSSDSPTPSTLFDSLAKPVRIDLENRMVSS